VEIFSLFLISRQQILRYQQQITARLKNSLSRSRLSPSGRLFFIRRYDTTFMLIELLLKDDLSILRLGESRHRDFESVFGSAASPQKCLTLPTLLERRFFANCGLRPSVSVAGEPGRIRTSAERHLYMYR
jgi:hypothetical protein